MEAKIRLEVTIEGCSHCEYNLTRTILEVTEQEAMTITWLVDELNKDKEFWCQPEMTLEELTLDRT